MHSTIFDQIHTMWLIKMLSLATLIVAITGLRMLFNVFYFIVEMNVW